jgi:hypothetical protein
MKRNQSSFRAVITANPNPHGKPVDHSCFCCGNRSAAYPPGLPRSWQLVNGRKFCPRSTCCKTADAHRVGLKMVHHLPSEDVQVA